MTYSSAWAYETELAAELVSASSARDCICSHLGEHDLPHLAHDMRLVVSELATNAVRHARPPFTVTLRSDGTTVLLSVRDGSSAVPVKATAGDMDAGGRGPAIVDELSHDWGVIHGPGETKSVWASFGTRLARPMRA